MATADIRTFNFKFDPTEFESNPEKLEKFFKDFETGLAQADFKFPEEIGRFIFDFVGLYPAGQFYSEEFIHVPFDHPFFSFYNDPEFHKFVSFFIGKNIKPFEFQFESSNEDFECIFLDIDFPFNESFKKSSRHFKFFFGQGSQSLKHPICVKRNVSFFTVRFLFQLP